MRELSYTSPHASLATSNEMPAKITHFKVTSGSPDYMKVPSSFWPSLKKIGLTPGVVLRRSEIPPTAYSGDRLITTGQLFALWRTIRELSKDPAAGWKLMSGMESA